MHGYGHLLGLLFLASSPGCLTTASPPAASCAGCHGADGNPAPPEGLGGVTATTSPGVGAHAAHTTPGNFATIACSECHVVPTSVDAPGHIDSAWPAEVVWGPVAKGVVAGIENPAQPFDRAAMTCTVFCHGAGLTGGTLTAPLWTQVDGTQDACGTCHGVPPTSHSPDSTACGSCHSAEAPEGVSLHGDGIVQLGDDDDTDAPAGCAAGCHGTEETAAPPPDASGSSDTSDRGVGAHATHLDAGVPCTTCHLVPATFDSPGHIDDDLPAEIVFGGLSTAGGSAPVWDDDGLTCSGTYCHDSAGGTNPAPTWNVVDGTEAACGACHGVPPPDPHPANSSCGTCHTSTDPAAHINGTVDF